MVDRRTDSQNEPSKARQFLAAFSASMAAVCAGMSLSWSSPSLPLLTSGTEPRLTQPQAAWVGSFLTLGAFLGCLPSGHLADLLGRKRLLIALVLPMIVGWCLLLYSWSPWVFALGRFILGFTVGVVFVATPTYINDVSTPSIRGIVGALFQLQNTVGILAMYVIGLMGTVYGMTLVCALFPLLFLGCFLWMPESPAYLVAKNRLQDAEKALHWLRGTKYDIQQELAELKGGSTNKGEKQVGMMEVFKGPASRKGIGLVIGVMFFQQASGVNAVVFYAQEIFEMAGGSVSPQLSCILIAIVTVLATGSATLLMDLAGRRVLLLVSAGLMSTSLMALGWFAMYRVEGFAWVPLVSLGLYCIAFSLGFGPIPWIIMAELFEPRLKASASAISAATSWGLAFLVTKYFQDLVTWLGIGQTFWIFSTFCGISSFFVMFLLPETKGKTTEEILLELGEAPKTSADSQPPATARDEVAV